MNIKTISGRGDVKIGDEVLASNVSFTVQTNDGGELKVETGRIQSENHAVDGARVSIEIEPQRYIIGTVSGTNWAGARRVGGHLRANESGVELKVIWTEILTTR